ncbi:MAG: homoprotocatechuate degradation operon regulator HpaR [Vannielia sp.]|uniref:homoprotocatechuate degradation operon regulator HpaR n=1 Tax=Rhodobacterales TaxID=204455 RepID=UPI002112C7E4|nr:homoprotocatechuate degradation operon regulator HpaR [Oceanicola sp. 502str15]MCO6382836.1 homoprotocatechuate degradation operon regulator HpaR [Oceanicola sp. 502str15]
MSDDSPKSLGGAREGTGSLRHTSRSLPIALLRAREAVMAPVRGMLAATGVTEQQWRVLRVLDENRTMEPKELANQACLLLPSLTRIMQSLEERALITREKDPYDGRKLQLAITEEGRTLIARHIGESNRIFAELEAAFGQERVDALLDLLNDLADQKT